MHPPEETALSVVLVAGTIIACLLAFFLSGCSAYEAIRQSQGKEPFSSPFTRHLDQP